MKRTVLVAALVLAGTAHAGDAPATMLYAGVLKDGAGAVVNGSVDVTFTFFDADSGGTNLSSEPQTGLVVVDGDLVADIGAPNSASLDKPELWLEVVVDGDTLSPRVRLESVPYAIRAHEALTLEGVATSDIVTQTQLTTLHLNNGIAAGSGITITNGTIAVGTITSTMLGTGAVTTQSIAAGAVTSTELGASSVVAGKIAAGTVVNADISATAAITGSKLAADSVGSGQLSQNAVGSSELQANAVVAGKIAVGTIVNTDVSSTAAIAGSKLASGSVTSTQLAANAVIPGRIAAGTIANVDISNIASIAGTKLAAGSITQSRIDGGALAVNRGPVACGSIITLATTCQSSSCADQFGNPAFRDCSNVCNKSASQVCTASPAGFIFTTAFSP